MDPILPPPADAGPTETVLTPADMPIPEILDAPFSHLCGPAGTGKTWMASAMVAQRPGTVLAATTGIAAVNLGEGCTTINALLRYFDTASLRDMYVSGQLTVRLGKLACAGVKRIVIDEVSMMDGDQLTYLTQSIDELSGEGYILDNETAERMAKKELDPIAITLVGDFAQLPPVKAPFAFESSQWKRYSEAAYTLTTIHRQADVEFIKAIQAARVGNTKLVGDYFGPRLKTAVNPDFDGATILATNDAVARFNALRMDKLTTEKVQFARKPWGLQRGDWKNIPALFDLKVGALVMLLANQRSMGDEDHGGPGRIIYANGDFGHIVEIDRAHSEVWVELVRNKQVVSVEWVTRTNTIPLEVGRRKAIRAEPYVEGAPAERIDGKMEIIGTVTYLPVRVAYATTVHKSQGLSLDQVQVDIREGFFKAPSMLYVALSRARTVEGLHLVGSVDTLRTRCTVDARVAKWL